jgi:UDP:flavonoid glycosyltransferase YjiC (YdhE family)
MRVLIATAGVRGDVAPLTGLATAIRAAGHSVTITCNDDHESLVVGCGLEFRPLPGTHGMFDDPRWLRASGGPGWAVTMIRLLAENLRTVNKAVLAVARRDAPDVLALAGITAACGAHVARGLGLPGVELQFQPVHPTADFPPSIVAGRSFGRLGNRAAGIATMTGVALVAAGTSGVSSGYHGPGSAKYSPGPPTPGAGRSATASARRLCRDRRTGPTAARWPATGGRSGRPRGARRRS